MRGRSIEALGRRGLDISHLRTQLAKAVENAENAETFKQTTFYRHARKREDQHRRAHNNSLFHFRAKVWEGLEVPDVERYRSFDLTHEPEARW